MTTILAEDNFKYISLNKHDIILIGSSLKFAPSSLIDNKPALVQVMAWRRTGNEPLPELILTQFADARGRWVIFSLQNDYMRMGIHSNVNIYIFIYIFIYIYGNMGKVQKKINAFIMLD